MKTAQRKTLSERDGRKLLVDVVARDGVEVARLYHVETPKPGKPGVVERLSFEHRAEAERAFSAALTRQATDAPGPRPYWWQYESTDWFLGPSLPRYQPL